MRYRQREWQFALGLLSFGHIRISSTRVATRSGLAQCDEEKSCGAGSCGIRRGQQTKEYGAPGEVELGDDELRVVHLRHKGCTTAWISIRRYWNREEVPYVLRDVSSTDEVTRGAKDGQVGAEGWKGVRGRELIPLRLSNTTSTPHRRKLIPRGRATLQRRMRRVDPI